MMYNSEYNSMSYSESMSYAYNESITTVGTICWTYWYSALISQILTPKSYHRLGLIDIFCVCLGIDCNILEQIAIWGVRSVPKNTHSATTPENRAAQFVHYHMPLQLD